MDAVTTHHFVEEGRQFVGRVVAPRDERVLAVRVERQVALGLVGDGGHDVAQVLALDLGERRRAAVDFRTAVVAGASLCCQWTRKRPRRQKATTSRLSHWFTHRPSGSQSCD